MSIVAAGCSASDTSAPPEGPTTTAAATTSPTTFASSDGADGSVTDPDDATEVEIGELLDISGIDLLTPETGGGARPELTWEPVDHAFFYNVVLLDPTGRGYWGWEGTTTAVHVGGEPVIKEGLSGPSVIDGMNWQVAAYDSDLNLIALSHKQPIAP